MINSLLAVHVPPPVGKDPVKVRTGKVCGEPVASRLPVNEVEPLKLLALVKAFDEANFANAVSAAPLSCVAFTLVRPLPLPVKLFDALLNV